MQPSDTRSALVVEDDRAMCAVFVRQLGALGFEVEQALEANEARGILAGRSFDLLLCDLNLGSTSGVELVREARQQSRATAIVMVSGEANPDVASDALAADVDEYVVKPFTREQLAITLAAAFRRRDEQGNARHRVEETKALFADGGDYTGADEILERLARAGRFRDEETAEHVERMSRACGLIAQTLGLSADECVRIRAASALHDIGKVGVPDAVLRKPGRLNSAERELIERHPEIGHGILSGSDDPTLMLAATVALTHHERIDGNGYPQRLAGDEIPLAGRIAAVADTFDALTHDRVYRPALTVEEALDTMQAERGSQFDPNVLDAFERVLDEILNVSTLYPDSGAVEVTPADNGDTVRALIVDDHDALARGMEILLRREGFEIAGRAQDVATARRILERRPVDVAVIDIGLDGESGLELVPEAKARGARALLYTGLVDTDAISKARDAGADGIAAKAGSPAELAAAIRTVAGGGTHFDARLEGHTPPIPTGPELTRREREIAELLAEGLTGEEVAQRLVISPETVRTHIRNAMNRVGARTRAHLIALLRDL